MDDKPSVAKRYLISAVALIAATLLSLAMRGLIRETPTLFFLAAVIISARWSGLCRRGGPRW